MELKENLQKVDLTNLQKKELQLVEMNRRATDNSLELQQVAQRTYQDGN